MPSERLRILELALESLENKKKQIDEEIVALTRELNRGKTARVGIKSAGAAAKAKIAAPARKKARFSKAERERRAARMKAYWDKWRKDRARRK